MGLAYVCVKISEYPPGTDGWCSITFNARFWCSKEPSHREDSFENQKCLSENIIVDLRIISKLTSKLNIKKAGQGRPASEMPFEWRFASGPILVQHCVLAGFIC